MNEKLKINRLYQVTEITGLSRSTIYLRMKNGEFPKPISLGGRAVGWLEGDIQAWLYQCLKASQEAE
jgi:prophage regulatory protein